MKSEREKLEAEAERFYFDRCDEQGRVSGNEIATFTALKLAERDRAIAELIEELKAQRCIDAAWQQVGTNASYPFNTGYLVAIDLVEMGLKEFIEDLEKGGSDA